MKTAIIVSKQDPAGMNIKQSLLNLFNFGKTNFKLENEPVYELDTGNKKITAKLYTTGRVSVNCENIDENVEADLFIFASMHKSETSLAPAFTVHSLGNWGNAELGGKDRTLCVSPSGYIKDAMIKLSELNDLKFEVLQEATHHGPFLGKPAMFIEVGPTSRQWHDKKAADVVAKAIDSIVLEQPADYETAFGIGGLHTAPNFKKIMLETNFAVGHICPKYNLQNLDGDLLVQAMEKQSAAAKTAILDWKGLGAEKERIVKMLSDFDIEFTRTDRF